MDAQKTYGSRLLIYLLLLLLVAGLMYSLKKCSYTTIQQQPMSSGGDTLDVAIEYAPLSIYTYDDTLRGFNYDLLRLMASKFGLKLKYHPIVALKDALIGLENGRFDMLAAEVPMTAENKDLCIFTRPIYLDRQVLVQLRDSVTGECRVKSQLDLAGDTVWVIESSPIASRVSNLAREIGDTIYTKYESTYGAEQLFIMTATGEIKQAVINERIAKELSKDYPYMDISTDISFTQFQSWVLGIENNTLADSVNFWLERIQTTPEYKELEQRYLK